MFTKHSFSIFFSTLLTSLVFGALFGFIGYIFADNLGFPVTLGTEEISMDASMAFYGTVGIVVGALVGSLIASKALKYTSKFIYALVITLFLLGVGLFLRDYMGLYTFIVYAAICSIALTAVTSYSGLEAKS